MIRIVFGIHDTVKDECLKYAQLCKGTLGAYVPKPGENEKYHIVDVFFDNLNDANSFIYRCNNRFGLYFYLKEMNQIWIT